MAIIKCPECGHDVSTMATACPNCGYPISGMNLKAPEQPEHEDLPEEPKPQNTTLHKFYLIDEKPEEPKPQNDALDEFDLIEGKPEQPPKEPSTEKPEETSAPRPGCALTFIIILAVIAVVITLSSKTHELRNKNKNYGTSTSSYSSGSSYSSSRSSGSSYSSSEIKSGVYALAKKCVKNHLKSPSSAKFSSMSDCEFEKGSGNTYIMAGTVESENSYGAMLSETWGIVAEVDGDKVSLVMLQIGDSIYSN